MEKKKKEKEKKEVKKTNDIDIKKIIIIVIIGLIIIGLGIFLIIKFSSKNREKEITLNTKVDIDIGGYKQVVTAKSITKNVIINEQKYVKINLDIENKKNVDSITALHQFKLMDKNNEEINPCYHAGVLADSNFVNLFPNTISANKVTSGYLYCPIESEDIGKLKIIVIAGGNIDSKNNITYEYKDYYLDLVK